MARGPETGKIHHGAQMFERPRPSGERTRAEQPLEQVLIARMMREIAQCRRQLEWQAEKIALLENSLKQVATHNGAVPVENGADSISASRQRLEAGLIGGSLAVGGITALAGLVLNDWRFTLMGSGLFGATLLHAFKI